MNSSPEKLPKVTEQSPRRVFFIMKLMSLLFIVLLFVAIFLLSRLEHPSEVLSIAATPPTQLLEKPYFLAQTSWTDAQGQTVELRDSGDRLVLITFWAHWCYPCLLEMPHLNRLQKSKKNELLVLAINIDGDESSLERAKDFLEKNNIDLRVVFDTESQWKTQFGVSELPAHWIATPEGQIIWTSKGAFNWTAKSTIQWIDQLHKNFVHSSEQ